MKHRYTASALLLSLVEALSVSLPADANLTSNLTVEVTGLPKRTGQICLSLFASSRGFPDSKENAVKGECVKITDASPRIILKDLAPKTYAVAVFWDDNEDGQLNRNFLGIPTEKFGFSGNPVIRTGPPKFGDSAIVVVGGNMNIQIRLQSVL